MIKRRADAALNRDQLLRAAESVFLEQGVGAPLDAIAARAGVGRATLFRNFADRHALMMALLEQGLDEIEAAADRIGDGPEALLLLLRLFAERISFRAPLIEYWHAADRKRPEIQAAIERSVAVFRKPIERAVEAGVCRSDLVPSDALLLISLLGGTLYARSPDEQALLVERSWQLLLDAAGLRNHGLAKDARKAL